MSYKIVNPVEKDDMHFLINLDYDYAENNLEIIGEGSEGVVFRYGKYAIKIFEEYGNDGPILEKLQDIDIFPKLYLYSDELMVTKYYDFVEKQSYKYYDKNVDIHYSSADIFKLCYERGYIPYDIHDENVLITRNDEFKLIDVGNFRRVTEFDGDFSNVMNGGYYDIEIMELQSIIDHVKRPPIAI